MVYYCKKCFVKIEKSDDHKSWCPDFKDAADFLSKLFGFKK